MFGFSSTAASTSFTKYVWLAYARAPLLTCKITGASNSPQACVMPCTISMLFTLNAPMAYPPLYACSNISVVDTKLIVSPFCWVVGYWLFVGELFA